jgi:pyridoxine 4-dehydrogenase
MAEIAAAHDKTLAQVAINWLITNEDVHVIPIPGMKSVKQVNDNVGSLGWSLTSEERTRIYKSKNTYN